MIAIAAVILVAVVTLLWQWWTWETPEQRLGRDLSRSPLCAGCDARGVMLALFVDGKRYCPRCAEEIVAMGWMEPVR